MRFFSNEAKENTDGQPVDEDDTDNATVPQQRTGSPWGDAPGTDVSDSTETHTDDSVREDTAPDSPADESLRRDDSEERHDGDDLVPDSDASSSHSHSDELDLPLDDRPADSTDDEFHPGSHRAEGDSVDESDAVDADRVDSDRVDSEPGAEQLSGTTTTYGPDGSVTSVDDPADTDSSADDTSVTEPVAEDATVTEPVATDTTDAVDQTDDERDLDEATPVVATAPVETDTSADDSSVGTDSSVDTDSSADDVAPDVAAVPVGAADAATTTEAAKPDLTASPVGDRLFTDGDSFNDRLRDVALNFVDNPKEATEQAGALVDEAIDKVTSSLKAQKDALAADGDDTEKLRVQLRGYRDILKRLTSL